MCVIQRTYHFSCRLFDSYSCMPIILVSSISLPFFVVGIVTLHIVDRRDTIEPANDKYHIVQDGNAKVATMYIHTWTRSPLQTSRRPALHGVESSEAIESPNGIDGITEGHTSYTTPTAAQEVKEIPFIFVVFFLYRPLGDIIFFFFDFCWSLIISSLPCDKIESLNKTIEKHMSPNRERRYCNKRE